MTVIDHVRALIDRLAPAPIGSACPCCSTPTTKPANWPAPTASSAAKDICSMCYGEKLVIRRLK